METIIKCQVKLLKVCSNGWNEVLTEREGTINSQNYVPFKEMLFNNIGAEPCA